MVEFCKSCGVSLAKGDLTIYKGQSFISHDYICPECGQLANPTLRPNTPQPTHEYDIVFRGGRIETAKTPRGR
jgi:hypothetical protein